MFRKGVLYAKVVGGGEPVIDDSNRRIQNRAEGGFRVHPG